MQLLEEANVIKLRAPGLTLGGQQDEKAEVGALADWVIPTLVPLQGIHWKNFPAPVTSQPCHLPTAAWIPKAALNPCLAGRKGWSCRLSARLCSLLFHLFCLCLFFLVILIEEKRLQWGSVGFMWVLNVCFVLTAL